MYKGEEQLSPQFYVVAAFLVCLLLCALWLLNSQYIQLRLYKTELEVSSDLLRNENLKLIQRLESLELQVAQLESALEVQEEERRQLSVQVMASAPRKVAYLTFDDGPSHNTAAILDILKEQNIKATFFVCGNATAFGKEMYKRIVDEGHSLGNHSYSHNYSLIYSSAEAFWEDHARLERLIYESTGIFTKLMRFPGGSNNTVSIQYGGEELMPRLCEQALEKGYSYFDWNISSLDAAVPVQETQVIIDTVLSRVRGMVNPVILFHDSSAKTTTVEALPHIIEALRELGISFAALSPASNPVRFKSKNSIATV